MPPTFPVFDRLGEFGKNALLPTPQSLILAAIANYRRDTTKTDLDLTIEICETLGALMYDHNLQIYERKDERHLGLMGLYPLSFKRCEK